MKNKILKLIDAYEKYIKALEDEMSAVSTIAYVHGWRSEKYEEGVKLRDEIIVSKKELKDTDSDIKKESVDEAAEAYAKNYHFGIYSEVKDAAHIRGFKAGAEWQSNLIDNKEEE